MSQFPFPTDEHGHPVFSPEWRQERLERADVERDRAIAATGGVDAPGIRMSGAILGAILMPKSPLIGAVVGFFLGPVAARFGQGVPAAGQPARALQPGQNISRAFGQDGAHG